MPQGRMPVPPPYPAPPLYNNVPKKKSKALPIILTCLIAAVIVAGAVISVYSACTYNQSIITDLLRDNSDNYDDYYIEENGKDVSYKGWSETDYFDLSKYKSLLVIGNDNIYNAIYDKNKQFIKTVNFFGTTLYNSKIGDVGTDIAYIKVTDAFKYMRLSNGTSI